MKVERGPATAGFVPVCSSVEDMHLHHLGGTRAAQEGSARFEEAVDPPTSTVKCYTDITDGKETGVAELPRVHVSQGVAELRPLMSRRSGLRKRLVAKNPWHFASLGDYEPVGATGLARLNLRARHTSGLALHFPRIKAIRRDKNVGFRRHP
jgi:hypothetical protein